MHNLHNTCVDILKISKMVIGAYNLEHVILRPNDVGGDIMITSSSSLFLKETKSKYTDPAANVLLEILSSHRENHGDMGWFCIMLASKLIVSLGQSEIPRAAVIQGYATALKSALRELDQLVARFRWSNHVDVICLIRSIVTPKTATTLSESEIEHTCSCVLDAFVSSLCETHSGLSFTPHILFLECVGTSPRSSRSCPGTLVMNVPLPHLFPPEGLAAVKLVVFENSLEISSLRGVAVELSGHDDCSSTKIAEYRALQQMRDVFVRAGVKLVCCQKRIHPHLQRLLAACGVVCLPRLSVRYIRSLLSLSGATQLGTFPTSLAGLSGTWDRHSGSIQQKELDQHSLGYLHRLGVEHTPAGRPVLVAEASPSQPNTDGEADAQLLHIMGPAVAKLVCARRLPICTLRVCARTDAQCRELRQVCEQAVRVLSNCVEGDEVHPRVLPGAGCWQAYVAQAVASLIYSEDSHANVSVTTSQDELTASMLFCNALEFCAFSVGGGFPTFGFEDPSLPLFSADRINPNKIRFSSPHGNVMEVTSASDAAGESLPGDLVYANVLDSYTSAVAALSTAVEAVLCVIDIDGILQQTGNGGF